MKKRSILQIMMLFFLSTSNSLMADNNPMRGNAKFNVVAVVLLIIFAGVVGYLIYLDRKITRMEKEKNQLS